MLKTVGIGNQDFKSIIDLNSFYIDKTHFLKEWWNSLDIVTLIARPRRFGKTLNISMTEYFFSNRHADCRYLFEGLSVWNDESFRNLQGQYPLISLSFSAVKETSFADTMLKMKGLIARLYERYSFLTESDLLSDTEKHFYRQFCAKELSNVDYADSINILCEYLYRYYGKKVIVLFDEYDTPLQEAYVNGYWNEMTAFVRGFFNATFKANSYLERGLLTGITRVSKESIFSDLNNLKVVTISTNKYADCFGFTKNEVKKALLYYNLSHRLNDVERWYDGFLFGDNTVIYNPWSVLNFLDEKTLRPYWSNTSSNSLISHLIQRGGKNIKDRLFLLMQGESIPATIDEQIVYNQLDHNEEAIWSLLLATGYVKILEKKTFEKYVLTLTNLEVKVMFKTMISDWFKASADHYNDFIKALLVGDLEAMNEYMNLVALKTFSYFDVEGPLPSEPERFYHGFVLGLMVELEDKYTILSNRESGFGRYDIMLTPKTSAYAGIIIEFKTFQPRREKNLNDTAALALTQIEEKQYEASLRAQGIENIRKYAFCFQGKKVLIAST